MSTINKTFLRVLLAIACCIALAFSLLPQAEAAMRADVVTGKVTLNGQVIDNKNAKYPLLTYSNITYFPMTYHLSRFMGVETDWNNARPSRSISTAGGAQSAYVAEPGKAPKGSVSVTLPSYRISVNGALIDNKEATYPIFNYNGVTYFPLTFRYAYESFGWGYQWDAENGLRIDTTSAPAHVPTEPNTGNAALDKALTILNSKYATGGKYHGMLEGGGKKTGFDATLDVSSTPDVTTVKFTAEPFPFFDNGVSYFANYYAVKGGFASDEQIGISGNSPELGDVGYPIYAEVAVWAENSYIGKCFLDCQFTGARSKHITDFKAHCRSSGSAETWDADMSPMRSDSFTGYTAERQRRHGKERRNADRDPHGELYPDDDARVTGFPSPPRRKKEGLHAMREVLLFISFQFARYFSRSPSGTSAPPVAQTMCAAFSQCAPRPLLSR